MNKYRNKRTRISGEVFDSKREARRWQELRLLEKAGVIKELQRQVKYNLIPEQKDAKRKVIERECAYIADFVYKDAETGQTVVEDAKGIRTRDYVIKRKLMLWIFGIRIREV